MKRLAVILLVLVLLSFAPHSLESSAPYKDVVKIKPVSIRFFKALKEAGNIPVATTYACRSHYRKDWLPLTAMRIKTVFVWTDQDGTPHLRATTYPPPVLEGYRAPIDGFNSDGTIPDSDRGYYIRYQNWLERPCVDLTDLLADTNILALWLYILNSFGGPASFSRELEYLGLTKSGRLPLNMFFEQEMKPMAVNHTPYDRFPIPSTIEQYDESQLFGHSDVVVWLYDRDPLQSVLNYVSVVLFLFSVITFYVRWRYADQRQKEAIPEKRITERRITA